MKSPKTEVLVAFRLPQPLAEALDRAAEAAGTDKSKFIRAAIRRQLADRGYKLPKCEHAEAAATA